MTSNNVNFDNNTHTGSMHQLSKEEVAGLSERSKYTFDLVNKWIENNDNKVSASCAVLTGVFGVISFLSERFGKTDSSVTKPCWEGIHNTCFILSLIVMGIATVLFCLAIIPNLKSNNNGKSKKLPLFFGDIASLSIDDYKKKVIRSSDIDFINELILETHMNSGICLKKMKKFKTGMVLSLVAIILAILSSFSLYMTTF